MHGKRIEHILDPGPLRISAALRLGSLAVGLLGLAVFFAAAFFGPLESRQEIWAGFMVSFIFFWFLAMGGGAFLAIQYVTGAKWFIVFKRLPESLASFAYRGGFAFAFIALAGMAYIYPWVPSAHYQEIWGQAAPDYPYEGTLKAAWLSPGVNVLKTFLYILPLAGLTFLLVRLSGEKCEGADSPTGRRRLRLSIIYLVVFAFLFSLYSWEMVMSVQPRWFSTMFGVYCFAGAFVSAIALMMLMAFHLSRRTEHVHGRHLYDMGTLVMGFATFMVYIGFSQFMLIWYANIPDETFWYLDRYQGDWWKLTVVLPLLKWIIPFFVLMPPPLRTHRGAQVLVCASILVGQALDIYWIFYPAYFEALHLPSLVNVATFIGVMGVFGWSTLTHLSNRSMLPVEDSELVSSVNGDYLHA